MHKRIMGKTRLYLFSILLMVLGKIAALRNANA